VLVALKKRSFSLADVQSDVLSLSRVHVTAFSVDQQVRRWCVVMRLCPCISEVLLQVAGVADGCLVHAFLH